MATIVVMPQLGNSVESCIIVEWMIAEGDTVAVDQTLASIETDKSTMEVPSTAEGTVLKLLWEEGDEVPVKDPLIIVAPPARTSPASCPAAMPRPRKPPSSRPPPSRPPPPPLPPSEPPALSPHAPAPWPLLQASTLAISEGSGPHGRVIERDVAAAIAAGPS